MDWHHKRKLDLDNLRNHLDIDHCMDNYSDIQQKLGRIQTSKRYSNNNYCIERVPYRIPFRIFVQVLGHLNLA